MIEALHINNLQSMKAFIGSHFMFNVLNQIQNRFLTGQTKEAVQVLSLYNKMLRHALNTSKTGMTSGTEEWKFLENYLISEQMRFQGDMQYHLTPELIEMGKMPAFILQPIVEATVHASLAIGHIANVQITFIKDAGGMLYQVRGSNTDQNIPEKYRENITRVKERIRIWNEHKMAPISLTENGDTRIIRMTL
jgi:LytS/YehU family sensor histidine kinase